MNHIMIDIETMGSRADSAVIAIGLAEFLPNDNAIGRTLEVRCTFDAMREAGRYFDPETVEWWMGQNKEAQEQLLKEPRHTDAKEMMDEVQEYLLSLTPRRWANKWQLALWAKGPNFDLKICRDLSETLDVVWPGHYGREYCVRTMLMIAKANGWTDILGMKNKLKHGALSDAIHQANQVMAVMDRVKS